MTRKDFYYPSSDGKTQIHAVRWIPENTPKAILQIAHGMTEHIPYYEPFASYLCDHGFLVVGNDHLGHGESVADPSCYGFFAEKNGNAHLLSDLHTLQMMTAADFPNLPYFVMGHSMGSFLMRQYIAMYGESLAGAIIMGTGSFGKPLMLFAKVFTAVLTWIHGPKYISKSVFRMSTASNHKNIDKVRTKFDWLSRDTEYVDQYAHDPLCTIKFTINGYRNMFYSIDQCQKKSVMAKIPKDLPILLISGEADSVGDFGKGVPKAFAKYKKAGLRNVSMKLYPEDRHVILYELNKEQVYADILEWLEKF